MSMQALCGDASKLRLQSPTRAELKSARQIISMTSIMAHGSGGATKRSSRQNRTFSRPGKQCHISSGSPAGNRCRILVARSADGLRLVLAQHGDDTVVLVSHDSTIRALLLQVLDQPL